jgi:hypothetical protein
MHRRRERERERGGGKSFWNDDEAKAFIRRIGTYVKKVFRAY